MRSYLKNIRLSAAALGTAVILAGLSPNIVAFAQTPPAAATLSEPTIKALQEALAQQGIAVKADGLLNEETRAAIRRYQSQHHLPVTGEADKATLDKLGIRQSAAPAESATTAQAMPTTPPAGSPSPTTPQMQGGMMMSGPMMQGMMKGMMETMQGMMGMMQGQMQPGAMQPGPMRQRQAQSGMMNCPMMPGASQGDAPAMMQMMQMMQGMMQMMQTMHGQMHPGQMQPGHVQPNQMQPGQMRPGPMQGGPTQPGRN